MGASLSSIKRPRGVQSTNYTSTTAAQAEAESDPACACQIQRAQHEERNLNMARKDPPTDPTEIQRSIEEAIQDLVRRGLVVESGQMRWSKYLLKNLFEHLIDFTQREYRFATFKF